MSIQIPLLNCVNMNTIEPALFGAVTAPNRAVYAVFVVSERFSTSQIGIIIVHFQSNAKHLNLTKSNSQPIWGSERFHYAIQARSFTKHTNTNKFYHDTELANSYQKSINASKSDLKYRLYIFYNIQLIHLLCKALKKDNFHEESSP